jgi:hypothetical protein
MLRCRRSSLIQFFQDWDHKLHRLCWNIEFGRIETHHHFIMEVRFTPRKNWNCRKKEQVIHIKMSGY